jgi:hypothetical protein
MSGGLGRKPELTIGFQEAHWTVTVQIVRNSQLWTWNADKMIVGRKYGHWASVRMLDQRGQRRRLGPISILFHDGSCPVLA